MMKLRLFGKTAQIIEKVCCINAEFSFRCYHAHVGICFGRRIIIISCAEMDISLNSVIVFSDDECDFAMGF